MYIDICSPIGIAVGDRWCHFESNDICWPTAMHMFVPNYVYYILIRKKLKLILMKENGPPAPLLSRRYNRKMMFKRKKIKILINFYMHILETVSVLQTIYSFNFIETFNKGSNRYWHRKNYFFLLKYIFWASRQKASSCLALYQITSWEFLGIIVSQKHFLYLKSRWKRMLFGNKLGLKAMAKCPKNC